MAFYKIVHKKIWRASTVDVEMGRNPDGSPNIVRQNGPFRELPVGTVLDDVTPAELVAFPDRLAMIGEEEATFLRAQARQLVFRSEAGVHEPASGPGDLVHKPPLTAAQVETLKQQEAVVATTQAEAAADHAKIDQATQAKQAKAFADLDAEMQHKVEAEQRAAERQARQQARETKADEPKATEAKK